VLHDGGQGHHRPATAAFQHQFRGTNRILGPASEDFGHRVDVAAALGNPDVETGLLVVTLLQGHVIPGELELMTPFQLQEHRLRPPVRQRWCSGQEKGEQDEQGLAQVPHHARVPLPNWQWREERGGLGSATGS